MEPTLVATYLAFSIEEKRLGTALLTLNTHLQNRLKKVTKAAWTRGYLFAKNLETEA